MGTQLEVLPRSWRLNTQPTLLPLGYALSDQITVQFARPILAPLSSAPRTVCASNTRFIAFFRFQCALARCHLAFVSNYEHDGEAVSPQPAAFRRRGDVFCVWREHSRDRLKFNFYSNFLRSSFRLIRNKVLAHVRLECGGCEGVSFNKFCP